MNELAVENAWEESQGDFPELEVGSTIKLFILTRRV
jgi:hypothetical protein